MQNYVCFLVSIDLRQYIECSLDIHKMSTRGSILVNGALGVEPPIRLMRRISIG